jgi:hypothetical protein
LLKLPDYHFKSPSLSWTVNYFAQDENRWADVRHMLLQELDIHSLTYMSMWSQDDFYRLHYSLNWFDGNEPEDRWMTIPNTGLVIASAINRPVVFISQQGWNTCFPLFSGPNLSQGTDPLVIARVGHDRCAHYICLTLDRDSPLPHNHPQWRRYRCHTPNLPEWQRNGIPGGDCP